MPRLVLHRWMPRHLLLAWCGYWLALVLGVLARPAVLAWRLTHDPASHGTVSASLTNDRVALSVVEGSATRWAASAPMLTLVLWLVVPPLLLYVVWLRSRPARGTLAPTASVAAHPGPELIREGTSLAPDTVAAGTGRSPGRDLEVPLEVPLVADDGPGPRPGAR